MCTIICALCMVLQVWTKLIVWTFSTSLLSSVIAFSSEVDTGSRKENASNKNANAWRRRHGEGNSGSGAQLPGRGVSEDDQRQVQAPHRLGPQGRPASLWRDPQWPAAG